MAETKLQKINEHLYHQPYESGEPFKWEKRLRSLLIIISAPRVELSLEINRPETRFSFSKEGLLGQRDIVDQDDPKVADNQPPYSQTFGWKITGTGTLDEESGLLGDRIGLIGKDGSIGVRFESLDVILKPIPEDVAGKLCGYLFHMNGEYERRKSYLCLELFTPQPQLEKICDELVTGRLSTIKIHAQVEAFQSEVDYSLTEPGMRQRFYIEEDEIYNRAYLSRISAFRTMTSSGLESEKNPNNRTEAVDAESRSGPRAVFGGLWAGLKEAIVVLAIIYVSWRVLTLIFR